MISVRVLTLLLLFVFSSATADTPERRTKIEAVDQYVTDAIETFGIPGASLALVHQGKLVHQNHWGVTGYSSETDTTEAVRADTPFLIGSNSKALTVYGLMRLVEQGDLSLDDSVGEHLPWFAAQNPAAQSITVKHLIAHTSGISAYEGYRLSDRHTAPGALTQQVRELAKAELIAEPGELYEYSPANYAVLGAIIEAVSGMPFADFMRSQVFDPLGMTQAAAHYKNAKQKGWRPGYRAWFDQPLPHSSLYDSAGAPYGYIAASAQDMARFLGELQAPSLLSPGTTAQLKQPLVERGSDTFYGYGWRIYDNGDYKKIWHSGSTADFRSEVMLLPDTGWGVVLLTNRNNALESFRLTQVAFGIEKLLNGEESAVLERGTPMARLVFYGLTLTALLVLIALFLRLRKGQSYGRVRWTLTAVFLAVLGLGLMPALVYFTGMPWRSLQLFVPDMFLLAFITAAAFLAGAAIAAQLALSGRGRGEAGESL